MVVKRALAHWRLLSAVIIGVVLACAIMAGTVVYFESLRELALKNALSRIPPEDLNIIIKADRGPTTPTERDKVAAIATSQVNAKVAWFLRDQKPLGRSATFFLTAPGNEGQAGLDNNRGYFVYMPEFDEVASIAPGGRAPRVQTAAPGEPLSLEALVPERQAQKYGIQVGETFSVVPYWDDVLPFASVVVTGLVRKNDPAEEFWDLEVTVLDAPTGPSFQTIPFYVSEETYLGDLGVAFKKMDSTYAWLLAVDQGSINARNAATARINTLALADRLRSQLFGYQQFTELDTVLADYDQRLFFTKLPMIIVLILIAVVILYYVVILSSLLVEQQRGEIALLRGRGAGPFQLLAVFALEGATIAVLGAVLGPLIASAFIGLAGFSPAFSDLTEGAGLKTHISASAYGLSAVGGLFSFMALIMPAIQASRKSMTRHRQEAARPTVAPFFQRYYLDVLLLAGCIVLFRQLSEQGSVVATRVFGDYAVNQMLLAVPALTLLAAAMVLLRLFPLALSLMSRLFSRWLPAGLVLAVWQMARNPTHYARLSLLLILTAGLGMFAASFGGTLERNFTERALYASGGDIRLQGMSLNAFGPTVPLTQSYEEIAGVDNVAVAYRGDGYDASKLTGEDFVMLSVDGKELARFVWTRDDFASEPVAELLRTLGSATMPEGLVLPKDATALQVRLKPDRPQPTVLVVARLRDANGRWFAYDVGTLSTGEWTDLEASLSRIAVGRRRQGLQPAAPLTLMSIGVMQTDAERGLLAGSILIDDVRVVSPSQGTVALETFDDIEGWSLLKAVPQAATDSLALAEPETAGGSASARFTWFEGPAFTARGVYAGPLLEPLPALANQMFVKDTGHPEGDVLEVVVGNQRVSVKIVGTFDYFPTLDTENERFLITDLDPLIAYSNLDPSDAELKPNEVWLRTSATGDERETLVQDLRNRPFATSQMYDREQLFGENQVDPLLRAGWRALLFIAFGAVLILSCVGFSVHAYVSFRNRQVQFALLRTVGLSSWQVTTVVLLEQALIIAAGMALGAWMGGRLGSIIMPFLATDDRGSQVLPPFILEVNWPVLLITYGVMVLIFAVITLAVILFVRRASVTRTLRIGEI
jgi:ABC-type lipoprotein release transport system permease subunit